MTLVVMATGFNYSTNGEHNPTADVIYYIELMTVIPADFAFSQLAPSLVAAAAIAASRHSLGLMPSWTSQLAECTGFTVAQVQPVALALIRCVGEPGGVIGRN